MHPIGDDTPTCTPEKEFTEGNPATSELATEVKAPWLNTVQRELLAILAAASIAPDPEDDDQVLEALRALFAALSHGHAIADVSGLQAALDARSLLGHLHAIADVTGLQTALDARSLVGHGHAIADVSGLQTALDARSLVGHLHDDLYAASLLVQAGQLLLKARSGATLSTVDISPLPPGTVLWHAAQTPPSGFLECNGSAVSRATYAALFAAIGATFGAGDGSTTFNLPDLRGEFARGWDHGRGADSGRAFGSAQAEAFKSHDHAAMVFDQGERAVLTGTGPSEYGRTPQMGMATYNVIMTGPAGGSETRPRNLALLPIIKF